MQSDIEQLTADQKKTRAVMYCVIGALAVAVCVYVYTKRGASAPGVLGAAGDAPGILPKIKIPKVPVAPGASGAPAVAPLAIVGAA